MIEGIRFEKRKVIYDYDVEIVKVVDGDTVQGFIDKGLKQYAKMYVRFARINANELTDKDATKRARAIAAKNWLIDRLPIGAKIYIVAESLDPYDRPISEVWYQDKNINDELLASSLVDNYVAK